MWTSNFEGLEIKSLHITIRDEDGGSTPARYGVWTSGHGAPQRERSSRLVVKVVSGGGGVSELDLDLCAHRFGSNKEDYPQEQYTVIPLDSEDYRQSCSNDANQEILNNASNSTDKLPILNMWEDQNTSKKYKDECLNGSAGQNPKQSIKTITEFLAATNVCMDKSTNEGETTVDEPMPISPLDYSLKKVNETNDLIMKGIQMLNRTLDYTKKREMLENLFPKAGSFECNVCGKAFVYESGLRRHAARHAGGVGGHAWQSVWTCGTCCQVWPRRELLTNHTKYCCDSTSDVDMREIKTSSLLQCEFCEKVFTSIPRLTTHSRSHTITRNYECSPCDLGFASYRAAEQHWRACSWLLSCYDFILQKMFLCNICDRKFRNYEQLYIHRYKAEHFATKTQYTTSGGGQLQMAVSQCELCGQAVPSAAHLTRHRHRSHPPDYLAPLYNQDTEEVADQATAFSGDQSANA